MHYKDVCIFKKFNKIFVKDINTTKWLPDGVVENVNNKSYFVKRSHTNI